MKIRKFTTGFTIIEIIIVIGIIAILTVVVFPSINNIRAKNRDTERIADIATIQLALSFYFNQTGEYPKSLSSDELAPKYLPADALIPPNEDQYIYVPLKKGGDRCSFYQLGVKLESQSAQIDVNDSFTTDPTATEDKKISRGYAYCGSYPGPGINPRESMMYQVHP